MFTYNSLIVLTGTATLGFLAGLVGAFMLLRRRALLGDVVSHATLPGIALMIIFLTTGSGQSYSQYRFELVFLAGTISGGLGLLLFYLIRSYSRLKDDVALALTLSVFFGFGIAVLGILQQMGGLYASGIESYLYGKTASLTFQDVVSSMILSVIVLILISLHFRQFLLISFDPVYAKVRGYAVPFYDFILFVLILSVCMLGLQAVGIILMLALLIIPSATMRFWSQRFLVVIWGSGVLGAMSAAIGSMISAFYSDIPSGPCIVLTATTIFIASLFLGTSRGLVWKWISLLRFNKKIEEEHVLRFWYEELERRLGCIPQTKIGIDTPFSFDEIYSFDVFLNKRSLEKCVNKLQAKGLLSVVAQQRYYLTQEGFARAEEVVHQHRLWELFLMYYADIAPSMLDRGADKIEHVLEPYLVRELEQLLTVQNTQAENNARGSIKSPHTMV